jgi:hypothetical protein
MAPIEKAIALFESSRGGAILAAALFAALIVWLIVVPRRRLYPEGRYPSWSRSPRVWAVIVAAIQMTVYLLFG